MRFLLRDTPRKVRPCSSSHCRIAEISESATPNRAANSSGESQLWYCGEPTVCCARIKACKSDSWAALRLSTMLIPCSMVPEGSSPASFSVVAMGGCGPGRVTRRELSISFFPRRGLGSWAHKAIPERKQTAIARRTTRMRERRSLELIRAWTFKGNLASRCGYGLRSFGWANELRKVVRKAADFIILYTSAFSFTKVVCTHARKSGYVQTVLAVIAGRTAAFLLFGPIMEGRAA